MAEIPIEKVEQMRQKGVSDDKIVESLKKDGFKSTQIFDAMSQADLEPASKKKKDDFPDIMGSMDGGNSGQGNPPAPQPPSQGNTNPQTSPNTPQQQGPVSPQSSPNTPQQAPPGPPQGATSQTMTSESNEELIESIIEEKWTEIKKDIQKVIEWKKSTEKKIDSLEDDISNLNEKFDKLHKAIVSKVGEYDKNILNVGADIKAMEKAFSKILPEFSQSVSELTELVDDLKKDNK